jgi:uncharacterized protein
VTNSNFMMIDWDVPITTAHGVVRADVFRPAAPGTYPVILSHGVYGKGMPVNRLLANMLANMQAHPSFCQNRGADLADTVDPAATGEVAPDDYRAWEVVDPSVWVPAGYVCVRVDSRGTGTSPGRLDPMAPDEIDDFADCIEWAGIQPWSNGRVGLCGKSYYAMTQWLVAARQPEHLAAICVWHGLSDWYRDATRHGGIMYQYREKFWLPYLVLPVQHGRGAGVSPHSGLPITGDDILSAEALADNRADVVQDIRDHPFDDDYYRRRTPDLSRIHVPVLASADWSDHDLHLRGTIRGFQQVSSPDTWLEIHAGGQFDDPESVNLQMRFFDYHLKDHQGDWAAQPRVQVAIRHADGSASRRDGYAWPDANTAWASWYADLAATSLMAEPPTAVSKRTYAADSRGITLTSQPFDVGTTLLGPVSATLFLSSTTSDADLFVTLDALDPRGNPVELRDHRSGLTPASTGWQRASQRSTDPTLSQAGQPFHPHDKPQPLTPGEVVEVDIELCPTSLHLPAGSRLQLTIAGNARAHNDPQDRPAAVFDNSITLYAGPDHPSQLLVATLSHS